MKNTTDLCYGNVPRAYKSVSLPPVGKSDHSAIHLIPAYRPKIQTDPIVKKSVKVWKPESEEQLRRCFECTEWSVLVDWCENVSEAADVVSSYTVHKKKRIFLLLQLVTNCLTETRPI